MPMNKSFSIFNLISLLVIYAPEVIVGLSLDDLVISSFATGPGATTLPMKIFSQMRLEVIPQINAVSTILIGVVTGTVTFSSSIRKRQEMR
jgi:putrescine transport system permease protein